MVRSHSLGDYLKYMNTEEVGFTGSKKKAILFVLSK